MPTTQTRPVDRMPDAPGALSDAGPGALLTLRGALPLKAVDVRGQVEALAAHVSVRQTFANPHDVPLEATFVFPVPDGMAVTQFRLDAPGREVEGVVREKGTARRDFRNLLEVGRAGGLADADRPDLFALQVGPIPAGAEAVVRFALAGPLPVRGGEVTFHFPLAVGGRYLPAKPLPVPAPPPPPPADADDPARMAPPTLPNYPHPVRLTLTLEVIPVGLPVEDLRCTQLAVAHDREADDVVRLALRAADRPDRDFVLRYRVPAAQTRAALVLLPDPGGDGAEGTFGLTLVAPPPPPPAAPKVVMLVDRSAAAGEWQEGVALELEARLKERLGGAEIPVGRLKQFPPADPASLISAVRKVAVKTFGEVPADLTVVLVTPGRVPDEDAAVRSFTPLLTGPRPRVRLLVVGIDPEPNVGFLNRLLAVGGRGAVEAAATEEAGLAAIGRVADRVAGPPEELVAVTGDGFVIDPATVVPPGRVLGAGGALALWGRFRGGPGGSAAVTVGGAPLAVPARASRNAGLTATWAGQYVRTLEGRLDQTPGAEAEKRTGLEEAAAAAGKRFKVPGRFTGFLAVERAGGTERAVVPQVGPAERDSAFSLAVDDGSGSHSSLDVVTVPAPADGPVPGIEETAFEVVPLAAPPVPRPRRGDSSVIGLRSPAARPEDSGSFRIPGESAPSAFDMILNEETLAALGAPIGPARRPPVAAPAPPPADRTGPLLAAVPEPAGVRLPAARPAPAPVPAAPAGRGVLIAGAAMFAVGLLALVAAVLLLIQKSS